MKAINKLILLILCVASFIGCKNQEKKEVMETPTPIDKERIIYANPEDISSNIPLEKVLADFTEHNWVKASFAKQGMPDRNSRQWDAVWDDGAMFKHGNLFQGLYVDPLRDVTAAYFSTCPVNLDPDILMGYIRQVAMNLAR